MDGAEVGAGVGSPEGGAVGAAEGTDEGRALGEAVGVPDGDTLGAADLSDTVVGTRDGALGREVGESDVGHKLGLLVTKIGQLVKVGLIVTLGLLVTLGL